MPKLDHQHVILRRVVRKGTRASTNHHPNTSRTPTNLPKEEDLPQILEGVEVMNGDLMTCGRMQLLVPFLFNHIGLSMSRGPLSRRSSLRGLWKDRGGYLLELMLRCGARVQSVCASSLTSNFQLSPPLVLPIRDVLIGNPSHHHLIG